MLALHDERIFQPLWADGTLLDHRGRRAPLSQRGNASIGMMEMMREIYVFAGRSSFFINYLHCWPALLQHIWLLRLIKHLEPFLLHASGFVSPSSTLPIFLRFRMCMWNENSERIIFSTLHTLILVICIWSGAQEFYHSHEITIENMSPLFLSSRFPLSPFCWQLNARTL